MGYVIEDHYTVTLRHTSFKELCFSRFPTKFQGDGMCLYLPCEEKYINTAQE